MLQLAVMAETDAVRCGVVDVVGGVSCASGGERLGIDAILEGRGVRVSFV